MISIDKSITNTDQMKMRGLAITSEDVISRTDGLLNNLGYYFRYSVDSKIYNFADRNRRDLTICVVKHKQVKICNLHSGICTVDEKFKKLSMNEKTVNRNLLNRSYPFMNTLIFDNFIFLGFNNDRVHAKAKLLFS